MPNKEVFFHIIRVYIFFTLTEIIFFKGRRAKDANHFSFVKRKKRIFFPFIILHFG